MSPHRGGVAIVISNRQRTMRAPAAAIRSAALEACAQAGCRAGEYSVVVVGDRAMRSLNLQYAGVEGTTDVLAFELGGSERPREGFAGEVIVNAAEALVQARRRRKDPFDELLLYVIHGFLHLGGYRDNTSAGRKRMRAAEAAVTRRLRAGMSGKG